MIFVIQHVVTPREFAGVLLLFHILPTQHVVTPREFAGVLLLFHILPTQHVVTPREFAVGRRYRSLTTSQKAAVDLSCDMMIARTKNTENPEVS